MKFYQAQYKYFHQIEPENKVLGYFKSKESAVKVLSNKYGLNEIEKVNLFNNLYHSEGISSYYINELLLED